MPRKGDGKISARSSSTNQESTMKGLLSALIETARRNDVLDLAPLRDEIRKEIESGNAIMRLFLGLMGSFEDIIPDERQRYNAAIRALSTTSGLDLQDVLESAYNQIEGLKQLEKEVLSGLSDFRDELEVLGSRSQEISDEMTALREKVLQLEKEEREIFTNIKAGEKERKIVEGEVNKFFAIIRADINGFVQKVNASTVEKESPEPVKNRKDQEKKGDGNTNEASDVNDRNNGSGAKGKTEQQPETKQTEWSKDCPLCRGKMNFHNSQEIWMCYSCGNEESAKGNGGEPTAAAPEPDPVAEAKPAAVATPPAPSPPAKKAATKKKSCPVCRKQMGWHEDEKSWICPYCDYQRRIF